MEIYPDEPSNIKWQNLTYSESKRFFRKLLSFVLALLLISFSVGLVIGGKYANNEIEKDFNTSLDCSFYTQPTEAEVMLEFNDTTLENRAKTKTYCFCENMLFDGNFASIRDYTLSDGSKPCSLWIDKFVQFYSLTVATIIVIPLTNSIIALFLREVTLAERNKFVSEDFIGNVWKTFLMQFFNTGLLLMFVNMRVDGFKSLLPDFPVFTGDYADFTPKWFSKVGAIILSSMLLSVFTPHISIAIHAFFKMIRKCFDSGCDGGKTRTKKVLKKDYIQLYQGEQFPIDFRFAEIFVNTFIALFYSSGMPILYFFTFLHLFLCFWIDKLLILRYYRKPADFDLKVAKFYLHIAVFGIIFHCLFAIWVFGNPDYIADASKSWLSGFSEFVNNMFKSGEGNFWFDLLQRTTQPHNILIFLFLVVLVGSYVVILIFYPLLRSVLLKKDMVDEIGEDQISNEIGKALPLRSIVKIIGIKKMQELLFELGDNKNCERYKTYLKDSILYGHKMIDERAEIVDIPAVSDLDYEKKMNEILPLDKDAKIKGNYSYDIAV